MIDDYEIQRTLSIVKELSKGKHLNIGDRKIAMGNDMSIGFLFKNQNNEEFVAGLSTLDLKELNSLLNKHEIGFPIPNRSDLK